MSDLPDAGPIDNVRVSGTIMRLPAERASMGDSDPITVEELEAITVGIESTRRRLMHEGRDFVDGQLWLDRLKSFARKFAHQAEKALYD